MKYLLFTYGTLQVPEVMQAVTGQAFSFQEATAPGFVRYILNGKVYPGMATQAGASTDGRVYVDVNECALTILDEFEDDLYERSMIKIRTTEGQCLEAFAYLIPEQFRDLLSLQCWDKDKFCSEHFGSYIQSCRTFHAQMMLNDKL